MHSIVPFPCPCCRLPVALAGVTLIAATLALDAADTVAAWDLADTTGKQVRTIVTKC